MRSTSWWSAADHAVEPPEVVVAVRVVGSMGDSVVVFDGRLGPREVGCPRGLVSAWTAALRPSLANVHGLAARGPEAGAVEQPLRLDPAERPVVVRATAAAAAGAGRALRGRQRAGRAACLSGGWSCHSRSRATSPSPAVVRSRGCACTSCGGGGDAGAARRRLDLLALLLALPLLALPAGLGDRPSPGCPPWPSDRLGAPSRGL